MILETILRPAIILMLLFSTLVPALAITNITLLHGLTPLVVTVLIPISITMHMLLIEFIPEAYDIESNLGRVIFYITIQNMFR